MFDKKLAKRYKLRQRRLKRAGIVAGICASVLAVFIAIAFNMFFVDKFTITIEDDPGLCLTIDEEKQKTVTTLSAPPLVNATDTQYSELPDDIDEGIGSKNTERYFAYSFYLGGISANSPSINYTLDMSLNKYSNNLEEAIRVMIIRNGISTIYAKSNEDGSAKPIYQGQRHEEPASILGYTKPFTQNKHIIVEAYEIPAGTFDKYTVVMWIDGWESVNEMKGGIFSADIKFSTYSIND